MGLGDLLVLNRFAGLDLSSPLFWVQVWCE